MKTEKLKRPRKSDEIRDTFLAFFEEKGHAIVRSSPLVPVNDPTILFTNAGMNQFKDVFLGIEKRSFKRATSSQKCLRVSGKHNDFEQVGKTAWHHTFFEMLGNFSFGDYFKKEAIAFGWELITQYYSIPEERLWVTVFKDDDEAFTIWEKGIGIDRSRIARLGEKDNFWMMGETGPCGPCSEIHFDQGEGTGCGRKECGVECDCGRFVELWNLVFIQYNRDKEGKLTLLPAPSIDTGMGMERLTAVLQGVKSNYDTDLFRPIVDEIQKMTGISLGSEKDVSIRVIADHVRAIAFLVADGISPSNSKRGYVLRRILRRAIRHGGFLGLTKPFLHHLTPIVIQIMGNSYPELHEAKNYIIDICQVEEERYAKTLASAVSLLEELITHADAKRKVIEGKEVFKLYDTYGLPLDLARDIASEKGYTIDEAIFAREMEKQREVSGKGTKSYEGKKAKKIYETIERSCKTEFLGYEEQKVYDCKILEIIAGNETAEVLTSGEEGEIILDRTPFYAESGGQVGDTGYIISQAARCLVSDTLTPLPGCIVHKVRVEEGDIKKGDSVAAEIDRERRQRIMRNHTATHLLHYALRDSIGLHIKQSGSLVEPERFRFDFSHYTALSPEIISEIERTVNRAIIEDIPVEVETSSYREALEKGVIAFFGEKYGENVRSIRIGEISAELCGGTHCDRTGQIGLFKIISERSTAAGIRRIEGVTGDKAFEMLRSDHEKLEKMKNLLNIVSEDPVEALEARLSVMKSLRSEIDRLRLKGLSGDAGKSELEREVTVKGNRVIVKRVDGLKKNEMRILADNLKVKLGSGIIILGNAEGEKVSLLVAVTDDLSKRYNASFIANAMAKILSGKGGGRADLAEAGGKGSAQLDEVLQKGITLLEEMA